MPQPAAARQDHTQVKETLVSIIIAFVLAFVFRAFVVEAFVIPTGSMAPTLMGQHEQITSPNTGYTWPVGPWYYDAAGNPISRQGEMRLRDPMTLEEVHRFGERRHSGDRILVFKYLAGVYEPRRYDVVVFKAPHVEYAGQNYIKRLVGLPGEELALIDGDVFARPAPPVPNETAPAPGQTWGLPGWKIQRKDERAQRAVWQTVFSSEYEPLTPPRGYAPPWQGEGWEIAGRRSYEFAGDGPAVLSWDIDRRTIDDFYPYNELEGHKRQRILITVNDIRLACGVEPRAGALTAAAVLRARGHEFRAEVSGRDATLRMRFTGHTPGQPPGPWATLATGALPAPLEPGRVTELEFWHADQALWLFVGGELVARAEYDWSPRERIRHALRHDLDELVATDRRTGTNTLALQSNYPRPESIRWEFSGGPVTLHRVGLDRDIHYESNHPADEHRNQRLRAAHPLAPMVLGADQFFVCGDNSPQSQDSRLWEGIDPWVAATIDPTEGIVPRHLMIGRAFFVYFPSLIRGKWSPLPMPDFGRMRFIW